MKTKQTETGVLTCAKHGCDIESHKGKLYCPECQKAKKCTECGGKIKFFNAGYATGKEKGKAPCLFYDPDSGKSRPVCKPCFVAQEGTEPIDYKD